MSAPLRLCMGFEKYTSNPVFMTNLVCIVVFAIAFPSYFAVISGEDGDSGASATSTPGDWFVGFNETQETFSETINMGDGAQEVSSFMGNPDTSVEIAWIEATFSCDDTDDVAGPFRDSISVQSDTSMVSGEQEEQSDETNCGGQGGGPITMRWDVVANYSGEEYIAVQESMDDIRAQWDDGDEHRGEWQAIIDMDVGSAPFPAPQDTDEDVEVTWTITYFVVEFEAFSAIME